MKFTRLVTVLGFAAANIAIASAAESGLLALGKRTQFLSPTPNPLATS